MIWSLTTAMHACQMLCFAPATHCVRLRKLRPIIPTISRDGGNWEKEGPCPTFQKYLFWTFVFLQDILALTERLVLSISVLCRSEVRNNDNRCLFGLVTPALASLSL